MDPIFSLTLKKPSLGTMFQAWNIPWNVPGLENTWYQVLGTKFLVPSTRYQVLVTKYLVTSTWYQVLGAKYRVPSTWHRVLGPRFSVLGPKYFNDYELDMSYVQGRRVGLGDTPFALVMYT